MRTFDSKVVILTVEKHLVSILRSAIRIWSKRGDELVHYCLYPLPTIMNGDAV